MRNPLQERPVLREVVPTKGFEDDQQAVIDSSLVLAVRAKERSEGLDPSRLPDQVNDVELGHAGVSDG
jgi:hypothetical protein